MTNTTHTMARKRAAACGMSAILCAVLVAAFFSMAVVGRAYADESGAAFATPAFAADEASRLGGSKAFEVTVFQRIDAPAAQSGAIDTWSYVFEAVDAASPMPEGSEGGRYAWRMTGDVRMSFSIGPAAKPGVYRYRMWQEHPASVPPGYTLDGRVYEVSAYAADDGTIYAAVCSAQGDAAKTADPGWTVSFEAPETAPSATSRPSGAFWRGLLSRLPKTGDISMVAIAAAGVLAVAGIAIVVLARRLREREDRREKGRFDDGMQEDMR